MAHSLDTGETVGVSAIGVTDPSYDRRLTAWDQGDPSRHGFQLSSLLELPRPQNSGRSSDGPAMQASEQVRGNPPALEPHYSVKQISGSWRLDEDVVRAIFRDEVGVLRIERPKGRYKRAYTTLRIPLSVLERVHIQMSRKAA